MGASGQGRASFDARRLAEDSFVGSWFPSPFATCLRPAREMILSSSVRRSGEEVGPCVSHRSATGAQRSRGPDTRCRRRWRRRLRRMRSSTAATTSNAVVLGDAEDVRAKAAELVEAMAQAARDEGPTVIMTHLEVFDGTVSPPGFASVVLLDESHLSAHCYSDTGLLAIDAFTCGTDPSVTDRIAERIAAKVEQMWPEARIAVSGVKRFPRAPICGGARFVPDETQALELPAAPAEDDTWGQVVLLWNRFLVATSWIYHFADNSWRNVLFASFFCWIAAAGVKVIDDIIDGDGMLGEALHDLGPRAGTMVSVVVVAISAAAAVLGIACSKWGSMLMCSAAIAMVLARKLDCWQHIILGGLMMAGPFVRDTMRFAPLSVLDSCTLAGLVLAAIVDELIHNYCSAKLEQVEDRGKLAWGMNALLQIGAGRNVFLLASFGLAIASGNASHAIISVFEGYADVARYYPLVCSLFNLPAREQTTRKRLLATYMASVQV
eukprot:TRINITY_DN37428_c0_g1_i1.p1 TRINITY_DN37428_c0_g1~~TRINITY_DN37428_c0_g1_i1.p1  ORF type:complete len:520 (-),score=74.92 TRINITY_DN37428_c0_g1_i1:168-1649(-)